MCRESYSTDPLSASRAHQISVLLETGDEPLPNRLDKVNHAGKLATCDSSADVLLVVSSCVCASGDEPLAEATGVDIKKIDTRFPGAAFGFAGRGLLHT